MAVAVVFALNGALFANWVARVPAVKDGIGAGTGALGLALLGIAVGSLLTMPFAGRLCERFGSRRVVVATAVASSLSLIGPALASSPLTLGLALVGYGMSFGVLDVAMNVQAVAVVRRVGRPIMPQFHAAFSLGGLLGAGTGALAAETGLAVLAHFAITGAVLTGVVFATRPHLLPDDAPAAGESTADGAHPRWGRRRLYLVGLGVLAGCAALGEGAMADWTALFLRDVTGAGAGAAALGFAAFSVTMTAGRLGGEAAIRRLGPVRVLRLGGCAVAAGVVLAVATASPIAGLVGFGLVGAGFSCAFPLALTTAGESSDGTGGQEIAAVSVIAYVGFLVGPPLIGLLAEVVDLRFAMLALVLPAAGLLALSPLVAPPSARRGVAGSAPI